jgi:hypothetical protein
MLVMGDYTEWDLEDRINNSFGRSFSVSFHRRRKKHNKVKRFLAKKRYTEKEIVKLMKSFCEERKHYTESRKGRAKFILANFQKFEDIVRNRRVNKVS